MGMLRDWKVQHARLRFEQFAILFVMLAALDREAAILAIRDTFSLKDDRQALDVLGLFVTHVEERAKRQNPQDTSKKPANGLTIGGW